MLTVVEPTSGHLKEILRFLPVTVADALEDYADAHGFTDLQVLELAIAGFLNLEAVSFGNVEDFKSVGELREKIAILETVIHKNGLTIPQLPQ